MEKKYQVFISSTYTDLIEERKRVRDTILSMLHFPVGMEIFGAADEEQWEIIRDTIDSSDYYVLLVAHRYGSVITEGVDAGISYTEKEYRYAKEKGIPILAFLIDEKVPVQPANIEKDNLEKLEAFKKEVKAGRLVEWWITPDDLAQKLSISLHKQIERKKRPGWVRTDSFSIEESHAEILTLNKRVRDLESENNKLHDELQGLLQEKNAKHPQLKALIQVDTLDDDLGKMCHPDLAIQDEDKLMKGIRTLSFSADKVDEHYRPITIDDFPTELKKLARQAEIDAYNDSLPSTEVLDTYKKGLVEYAQITKGCVHVCIDIRNNGTAKANNISVTLEFPDGIDVYDQDILCLEKPKAPSVKKSPIELAEKRKCDPFGVVFDKTYWDITPSQIISRGGLLQNMIINPNDKCECFDHTLEVNCSSLIHTRSYRQRGIYLVGKKAGHYQIKCTLMCEEYEEPQVEWIDFEVVDN